MPLGSFRIPKSAILAPACSSCCISLRINVCDWVPKQFVIYAIFILEAIKGF